MRSQSNAGTDVLAMDCPICVKHRAGLTPVLLQTAHGVLSHYPCGPDTPSVYRGHLFVEAMRHVTSFADLTDSEAAELGVLAAKGSRLLKERIGAEHVYAFTIGHLVPHLHLHLVARYPGTPKEFWGGWKVGEWPEAPRLDAAGVEELTRFLGGSVLTSPAKQETF